jgi:hypothetical protein
MTGDHATLSWLQMQPLGRGQIGLGQDFVLTDSLARKDRIPTQTVSLGRVDDHPEAEDGERRSDIVLPQNG